MTDRHPLVALSSLSTHEQWCWNLVCSTCGHMYFRYALVAIAHGGHPDSPSWNIHSAQTRDFGPLPKAPLAEGDQQALAALLATLAVSQLLAVAQFPDWLGHLGLALYYSTDAEAVAGNATRSLVPQLARLVSSNSPAATRLANLGSGSADRLRWTDLELVEQWFVRPPSSAA